jgi:predicted SprT family Zn-dependent metalloprotease
MNFKEALTLARREMDKHGLTDWSLSVSDSTSVAGTCKTKRWNKDPKLSYGTITLSRPFFEAFDHKDALNIILHEIAHALDEPRYKWVRTRNGGAKQVMLAHDAVWKAIARRIGCTGDRCVPETAAKPADEHFTYKGVCPKGHEIRRKRLTERAKGASCVKCTSKFDSRYMFDFYYIDNGRPAYLQPKRIGAKTGRFSTANPNLDDVPGHPELVRKKMVPNRPLTAQEWATLHSDTLKQLLNA